MKCGGGIPDIGDGQFFADTISALPLSAEAKYGLFILLAFADGLLENSGVGGQPSQSLRSIILFSSPDWSIFLSIMSSQGLCPSL
jgi:hypothetical protein